jgi:hypothetical protein
MTDLEESIYSAIDVLQKQIANDRMAISSLLNQLPCKYIITRTFIKDWECHRAKCSVGHKMYYSGNANGFDYDEKKCHYFKSLRDAEIYLEYCKGREILKDYVEIKIERVEK